MRPAEQAPEYSTGPNINPDLLPDSGSTARKPQLNVNPVAQANPFIPAEPEVNTEGGNPFTISEPNDASIQRQPNNGKKPSPDRIVGPDGVVVFRGVTKTEPIQDKNDDPEPSDIPEELRYPYPDAHRGVDYHRRVATALENGAVSKNMTGYEQHVANIGYKHLAETISEQDRKAAKKVADKLKEHTGSDVSWATELYVGPSDRQEEMSRQLDPQYLPDALEFARGSPDAVLDITGADSAFEQILARAGVTPAIDSGRSVLKPDDLIRLGHTLTHADLRRPGFLQDVVGPVMAIAETGRLWNARGDRHIDLDTAGLGGPYEYTSAGLRSRLDAVGMQPYDSHGADLTEQIIASSKGNLWGRNPLLDPRRLTADQQAAWQEVADRLFGGHRLPFGVVITEHKTDMYEGPPLPDWERITRESAAQNRAQRQYVDDIAFGSGALAHLVENSARAAAALDPQSRRRDPILDQIHSDDPRVRAWAFAMLYKRLAPSLHQDISVFLTRVQAPLIAVGGDVKPPLRGVRPDYGTKLSDVMRTDVTQVDVNAVVDRMMRMGQAVMRRVGNSNGK